MMHVAGALSPKNWSPREVREALLHNQDIPGSVILLVCTGAGTWDLRLVPGHGVFRVRDGDGETLVEWEPFMASNSTEKALDLAAHYIESFSTRLDDDEPEPWVVAALMLDRNATNGWVFTTRPD